MVGPAGRNEDDREIRRSAPGIDQRGVEADRVVEIERLELGESDSVTVRDSVPVDAAAPRFVRLNVQQSS